MLSAIPPTTSQPADVHQAWKEIPMSSVSELSAESTKTVPRTPPVSPIDVSTHACMKTHVHPQPLAQYKTTMPNVCVRLDGLETHLCLVHQKKRQLFLIQNLSATQTETVPMILPV